MLLKLLIHEHIEKWYARACATVKSSIILPIHWNLLLFNILTNTKLFQSYIYIWMHIDLTRTNCAPQYTHRLHIFIQKKATVILYITVFTCMLKERYIKRALMWCIQMYCTDDAAVALYGGSSQPIDIWFCRRQYEICAVWNEKCFHGVIVYLI